MMLSLITALAIVGTMMMLYVVWSALRSHGIGPALIGVCMFGTPVLVVAFFLEVMT